MTHIDYLIVSMHEELKPGIVGFSIQGLTGCNGGVGQDTFSSRELRKNLFPRSFRFLVEFISS